jgi:glycerophosphoryl diester phosphodiesterase
VPTLHDFLSEAKQLNMNLFIEMKNVNNKTYFLNEIKQNLDYFDYYNKSILLSFFPDLLKGIRSQNPRIYSMLLTRPDSISYYSLSLSFFHILLIYTH